MLYANAHAKTFVNAYADALIKMTDMIMYKGAKDI